MSDNKKCCVCGSGKKITIHHLFPRRYYRYLPKYWEIRNNKVWICEEHHSQFESIVNLWYQQIEKTIKPSKLYFRRSLFSNMNDRQIFKFIIVVRFKFFQVFGRKINPNILTNTLKSYCDDSLKEYLNA